MLCISHLFYFYFAIPIDLWLFQHCPIEYSKFDTETFYQSALIVQLMTDVAVVGHLVKFHSIKTDHMVEHAMRDLATSGN